MSRFVFAGNEIIPGTVIMTADGAVTPKDDLRVILNISGGGNVTVPDGTDTTQRIELVNVSADTCSLTYKGTGGSTTASIYTNTGIRLLWVGTYWETSMSTAVTGIDDNSQPFAFNIDSLVKPDGVINLTGTDADGNPFDYGLGKLVTVADEDNLVTGVEVKTSKTLNGKPIYKMYIDEDMTYTDSGSRRNASYSIANWANTNNLVSAEGIIILSGGAYGTKYIAKLGCCMVSTAMSVLLGTSVWIDDSKNLGFNAQNSTAGSPATGFHVSATIWYTKTTD